MRIMLIMMLTIGATNVKAEDVVGPEAVKLALRAKAKGLVYEVFKNHEGLALHLLVDKKYYHCVFHMDGQSCVDHTRDRKKK